MVIHLRKRRHMLNVPIGQVGQQAAGSVNLPPSAYGLTGVGAFAQPRQVHTPVTFFYYGAGPVPPAELATLTKKELTTPNNVPTAEWSASAGGNEYLYYAYPIDLKEPVFAYQGFQGGFYFAGYRNLSHSVGGVMVLSVFALWQSATPNLGADVALTVTHP